MAKIAERSREEEMEQRSKDKVGLSFGDSVL